MLCCGDYDGSWDRQSLEEFWEDFDHHYTHLSSLKKALLEIQEQVNAKRESTIECRGLVYVIDGKLEGEKVDVATKIIIPFLLSLGLICSNDVIDSSALFLQYLQTQTHDCSHSGTAGGIIDRMFKDIEGRTLLVDDVSILTDDETSLISEEVVTSFADLRL